MKFDYSNLIGKISTSYGSRQKFAKELGISYTGLRNKLSNKVYFTQGEMIKTINLFDVPVDEIPNYFFCLKSCESSTYSDK